jgi:hypothetical protein
VSSAEQAAARLQEHGYLIAGEALQAPGAVRRCPHCGQTWPLPEVCGCGHGITAHAIGAKGKRTACSVTSRADGACGCRAYAGKSAATGEST